MVNFALICSYKNEDFLKASLETHFDGDFSGCLLMANYSSVTRAFPQMPRMIDAGMLEGANLADNTLYEIIADIIGSHEKPRALIVDMAWVISEPWGGSAIEAWAELIEKLASEFEVEFISLYDQEILVEEDLAAVLRSHRHFLAPSGQYVNPYWLPPELAQNATTDAQLRFLLERAVPDYAKAPALNSPLEGAARGTAPDWVPQAHHNGVAPPLQNRWHIHCLGELKVFVGSNEPIEWRVSGSSPTKSKLLFAYLLARGRRSAHSDQICEILWPDCSNAKEKRHRLHHTISTLRKTLGGTSTVLLEGESYRLNIPAGSWLDMERFEQLCRRGLALLKNDDLDGALKVYAAAERLYKGDLFDGLPVESMSYSLEDWCTSRRRWLASMAAKLQYDMSRVLRQKGRLNDALSHCQQALVLDPMDDNANIEMLHVLLAQGRLEALVRHYKHFEFIAQDHGVEPEATGFYEAFHSLLGEQSGNQIAT